MRMGNLRAAVWLFFSSLALSGCFDSCAGKRKSMTPEQVVEAYLNIALNMKDVNQRGELLSYTIGTLREVIESADNETIRRNFIDKYYRLKRYTVVERRDVTPREVEITYQLEFNELASATADPDQSPLVQNENTVSVIRKQGYWFIQDVVGAKTTIDFALTRENTIELKPGTTSYSTEDSSTEPLPEESQIDSSGDPSQPEQ